MAHISQWKTFDFFEVNQVKPPDDESKSFLENNEISCVCSGSDSLFLGSDDGVVRILSSTFKVLRSFQAHDTGSITYMKQLEGTSLLVTISVCALHYRKIQDLIFSRKIYPTSRYWKYGRWTSLSRRLDYRHANQRWAFKMVGSHFQYVPSQLAHLDSLRYKASSPNTNLWGRYPHLQPWTTSPNWL